MASSTRKSDFVSFLGHIDLLYPVKNERLHLHDTQKYIEQVQNEKKPFTLG